MHTFVTRHVVWTWIALLGLLFSALAPAVAHAMAASPAGATMQLCTAQGMVSVAIETAQAGEPAAPAPDHQSRHCPYCAAHGAPLAPPSAPGYAFPLVRQSTVHRAPLQRAPAPRFAWRAARPRAPPLAA